jgi:HSP20 family molecular chaperone IbpA
MIQYIGLGTLVPHQAHISAFGHHGLGQFGGQSVLPTSFGVPTLGGVGSLGQPGLFGGHLGGLGLGNVGTPSYYNPCAGLGYFTPSVGLPIGNPQVGGSLGSQGGHLGAGTTLGFAPFSPLGHNIGGGSFGSLPLGVQSGICGDLQGLNGLNQGNCALTPNLATELCETAQDYILSFDVPGMEAQDLDVSFSNNTIYLNGTRNECHEPKALAYTEIARGPVSRAIALPFEVSAQKTINTSLENGVLKIRIAKENQCGTRTGARKIKIG